MGFIFEQVRGEIRVIRGKALIGNISLLVP